MTQTLWPRSASLLLFVAGLLCIVVPWIAAPLASTLFIGRMLIFCGFANSLRLVGYRPGTWGFIRQIPRVVVPLLMGVLILLNDGPKARSLTVMLMIFFVLDGYAKVIAALESETMHVGVIGMASAGLSFFLAVFLAATFPNAPVQWLALFLGFDLISMAIVRR